MVATDAGNNETRKCHFCKETGHIRANCAKNAAYKKEKYGDAAYAVQTEEEPTATVDDEFNEDATEDSDEYWDGTYVFPIQKTFHRKLGAMHPTSSRGGPIVNGEYLKRGTRVPLKMDSMEEVALYDTLRSLRVTSDSGLRAGKMPFVGMNESFNIIPQDLAEMFGAEVTDISELLRGSVKAPVHCFISNVGRRVEITGYCFLRLQTGERHMMRSEFLVVRSTDDQSWVDQQPPMIGELSNLGRALGLTTDEHMLITEASVMHMIGAGLDSLQSEWVRSEHQNIEYFDEEWGGSEEPHTHPGWPILETKWDKLAILHRTAMGDHSGSHALTKNAMIRRWKDKGFEVKSFITEDECDAEMTAPETTMGSAATMRAEAPAIAPPVGTPPLGPAPKGYAWYQSDFTDGQLTLVKTVKPKKGRLGLRTTGIRDPRNEGRHTKEER